MSDHLATEIRIGGKVPAQVVPKLLQQIKAEHLTVGWEEEPFTATTAAEVLELTQKDELTGTLQLVNHEAAWGRFEELEAFLCKHGIAFDRRTEGKHQYDPELAQFRPRMKEPCVRLADQCGRPVVSSKDLQVVFEALEQHQCTKALWELRRLFGPTIPALKSLHIVPRRVASKGTARKGPKRHL